MLLDEVNLATNETLQRLCSLLDGEDGSLAITERGDVERVKRHPEFRLQALPLRILTRTPRTHAHDARLGDDTLRNRLESLSVGGRLSGS